MSDRNPRMLAGPTARTARGAATALLVASFLLLGVLTLGFVALRVFSKSLRELPWEGDLSLIAGGMVILCGVLFAAFGVTSTWGYRLSAREVEAGYTTLLKEFYHVDGIDPKTGIVVRPAVVRTIGNPAGDAITSGAELGPIDGIPTPIQVMAGIRVLLYGYVSLIVIFLTSLILFLLAFASGDPLTTWSTIAGLLATVTLIPTIAVPVLVNTVAPWRRYAELVSTRFPESRLYGGRVADPDTIIELLEPGTLMLPGAEYRANNLFVFTPTRLIAYSRYRRQFVPFLSIPHTRVIGARVTYPSTSVPSPVLTIHKGKGSTVGITLLLGGSGPLTLSRAKAACDWVVGWATTRG